MLEKNVRDSIDESTRCSFYLDPDKIAVARIALGFEPYGAFPEDEDSVDLECAFRGVMEDIFSEAIAKFVKSPKRARTLFELEKVTSKLAEAVAEAEGFKRYTSNDVERTRFRDRLRQLRAGWAQKEADVVRPLALTEIERLLQAEHQLKEQLYKRAMRHQMART